jgi:hypothetical protein
VAAAAAVLGFSFWMFENNIFQSSKNENPIVKNVPKTDSVFHKSSSETLATQAIAENEIKINQKENLINHQNKIIVAAKKLDEKRSIAKMPDSKLVVPERNFISRVDVFYQKTEQPKIISKTNIPTNIQKKEINSLLELSAPSLEEIVAISPRENEKKRNRFFKNLSEKIKEKSMAILSDDNENIIIAGFAVNVRK